VTWNEACHEILDELGSLLCRKQHDYGHENIKAFGEFGVLVRANDKFARLRNLITKGLAPKNETKEDTWFDVAGYAVIAIMLNRGLFDLELAGPEYPRTEDIRAETYESGLLDGIKQPRRPMGA
jgi:hypothetical protein